MIKIYNRKTNNYDVEKVSGEKYLNWTYSSPVGISFLELIIKKKFFSFLYGKYCDSKSSSKKIKDFVKEFNINMDEAIIPINGFESFNNFFTRKVKPSSRPIDLNKNIFISPGDGRLSAYENIDLNKIVQIKGLYYSLDELINSKEIATKFKNGICLILRLCPTDYHRFHFVDNGVCDETKKIKGRYYSVNPIALNKIPKLFCKNKREWSLFHSENFGDVLYIEVGATCVGSIIQSYSSNKKISKGDEKGFFKFGGSTVILFLQEHTVKIDENILHQTTLGYETKVNMGEKIGEKI
ncbi:phosphatidylserine decarboxylase [Clostridium tetanomorphum]|uniref:phosphatidylserine decarboxylase n=1 Tax=Clostridium tetanomorphum TaxID=1553 RepID=UPI00044DBFA6|nr:phosphatidylserine decarboxylase [Clostridium tetanomorphum]KAJ50813.1 phosphatidylserine decarboxylase [Clostridium tetanomorphum DSM 665]MBP1866464.1 phosphatidylserine decarboxylase [Clostridium tetanomorphum]NRS86649.1 phosphatidylserine decarboxylase [Clostridium tetanomorphum]SQC01765.1 phosphatidylserine decarboxylase [Clostridium tetanomorphum]